MLGMSAFRTLELARARWLDIAELARRKGHREPRVGSAIAQVRLVQGHGLAFEDLGHKDGHLTIWGAAEALTASVVAIVEARLS
jgi:hypothetical protein